MEEEEEREREKTRDRDTWVDEWMEGQTARKQKDGFIAYIIFVKLLSCSSFSFMIYINKMGK